MISEEAIRKKLTQLVNDVRTFEAYSRAKASHRDRHGLIDAEMDLRELDAMVDTIRWVLGERSVLP